MQIDTFAYDIILQGGIKHLSFKTPVDDIEWSESRRVDYGLCLMRLSHDYMQIAGIKQLRFGELKQSRFGKGLCWRVGICFVGCLFVC